RWRRSGAFRWGVRVQAPLPACRLGFFSDFFLRNADHGGAKHALGDDEVFQWWPALDILANELQGIDGRHAATDQPKAKRLGYVLHPPTAGDEPVEHHIGPRVAR